MNALLAMAEWAGQMAVVLGRASLSGGLLILAVWGLCRLVPRLPAALRTWLWWIACLRLLVGLIGLTPVRLPLLPAGPAAVTAVSAAVPGGAAPLLTQSVQPAPAQGGGTPLPAPFRSFGLAAASAVGTLWLLAVAVQLAFAARQLRRLRGVLRSSAAVTTGWIAALWTELCRRVGISGTPVLAAAEVATPQAAGLWRPRVLLPRPQLDRLSAPELSMVLCHELVHLRRRDLWLGWVPALAERLFFFHPLAALAAREYALAREAACDAEVLAVLGAAPQAYGRMLLKLGVGPRATALTAATAAPSRHHLKRRLQMLSHAAEKRPSVAWWVLLVLLAVVGLIPFRLVAAQAASQPLRAAAGPPPSPPTPPISPISPTSPRAPAAPHPPKPLHPHKGPDDGEFVLLSADGSSTMMGSTEDVSHARQFLQPGETELLWFRRGGKEYVVHDPQTLRAARALFAPQAELGARQAELGSRQAELGSQQAALGAEQAKLGAQQSKLGAEQARMAGEEARSGKGTGHEQDALGKKQNELGRQQDGLGKKQDALGKQQDELGKQQGELGKQQEKLAQEAETKLRGLLDDAIAKGLAHEVGA